MWCVAMNTGVGKELLLNVLHEEMGRGVETVVAVEHLTIVVLVFHDILRAT